MHFFLCTTLASRVKPSAKKESRPLKDGEAKTACMQACPTEAIVFGNVKDTESKIYKIQKENPNRLYYVLDQLHTLPNISYLAKVHKKKRSNNHPTKHATQDQGRNNTDEILEKEKVK